MPVVPSPSGWRSLTRPQVGDFEVAAGDRNLLEAALVGAGLFIPAHLAVWLVERYWGPAGKVHFWLHSVLPFPYVGSFLGAFAL